MALIRFHCSGDLKKVGQGGSQGERARIVIA